MCYSATPAFQIDLVVEAQCSSSIRALTAEVVGYWKARSLAQISIQEQRPAADRTHVAWGPKKNKESEKSVAVRLKNGCDGNTARDVKGFK